MNPLLTIVALITVAVSVSYSNLPKNEIPSGAEEYYETMPDIDSCNAGVLLQSEKNKILDYTNYIRSLHDLKPVVYDETGQSEAMAAALVCAANGAISYDPPADWHCYSATATSGAASSNLYISMVSNLSQARSSEQSMISWMHGQFTEYVGHRRAIINPFLKSIAFGRVDGKPVENQFYASAMSLKCLDNLGQDVSDTDIEYVAFPYRDYPTELVDKNWYLSFSAIYNKSSWSGNNNVDYSQVSIAMTADGLPISVGEIIHDNQGWGGIPNCLKWKVPGLADGVRYNVEIKNLRVNGTLKDYSYWFVLGEEPKNTPDSLALVALYNATDGPNWSDNTNWLSGEPLEEWVGVTINQDRVTRIGLYNNNLNGSLPSELGELSSLYMLSLPGNFLTGEIPSELSSIENLQHLDLGNNGFEGTVPAWLSSPENLRDVLLSSNNFENCPDLKTNSNISNLDIGDNRLEFDDIEPNIGISDFKYWPQDSVGAAQEIQVEEGAEQILSVSVGGANNRYQWYLDDSEIPGADSDEYTISSMSVQDEGVYTCKTTNTVAMALDIWSRPITIIFQKGSRNQDSLALVALYNATDGPNWKDNTNWLSGEPIDNWYGVTVRNGRVSSVKFRANNLTGDIPDEFWNLTALDSLSIFSNPDKLGGSLPPEIENLINIKYMNFEQVDFSGQIPKEIGNLINLEHLQIWNSHLAGEIPPEIGNLKRLRRLKLMQTMGGLTKIPSELGSLDSLVELEIIMSIFNGAQLPPELGNLSNLEHFNIWSNDLSGNIPPEIGNLSNLKTLWLMDNALSGSVPRELGDLSNLLDLDLRGNKLSGSLPSELGNLSELRRIDLSENQLSGSIPSEFGNLTKLDTELFGASLDLKRNQFSGEIPPELGNLTELKSLDLSENQFTGEIPSELQNLKKAQRISLDYNHFLVCPNFNELDSLKTLEIENNVLEFDDIEPNIGIETFSYAPQDSVGAAQEIQVEEGAEQILSVSVGGANNVYQWYLDNVEISGADADEYTISSMSEQDEGEYVCEITNSVATELTLWSRPITIIYNPKEENPDSPALVALYNATDGPNWTNNTNWLSDTEPIDNWYGVTVENRRVTELDLSNNLLSGELPPEIGDLTALLNLDLKENTLGGSLPAEIGNLTNLETLILYNNDFAGELPPEIGNLTNILELSLSWNNLTGELPSELGNLSNMTNLDLEANDFTGSIPAELNNLYSINSLYLQDNGFTYCPDLSGLPLGVLSLENNALEFDDIEPNIGIETFSYSPQDSVGQSATYSLEFGDSQSFSVSVGGNNNVYQWYLDGVEINGADDFRYSINSMDPDEAGDYVCKITNSVATELTLWARPITVQYAGAPQSDLEVVDKDFGEYPVRPDLEKRSSVTIRNNGNSTIEIDSLSVSHADFTLTEDVDFIRPGRSINVGVNFKPSAIGNFGGELTAHSGATRASGTLTGTGIEMPKDGRVVGMQISMSPNRGKPGDKVKLILSVVSEGEINSSARDFRTTIGLNPYTLHYDNALKSKYPQTTVVAFDDRYENRPLEIRGTRRLGLDTLATIDLEVLLGTEDTTEIVFKESPEWVGADVPIYTILKDSVFIIDICRAGGDRLLKFKDDESFIDKIKPQPTETGAEIEFFLAERGEIEISLTNIFGEKVWKSREIFSQGYNVTFLNVSDLPSGTYMLTLNSSGNLLDMKKMLIVE